MSCGLLPAPTENSSQGVRGRVEAARERQERRYRNTLYTTNAELPERGVRQHCPVTAEGMGLLEREVTQLGLSTRAYVRVLRVARTIGRPSVRIERYLPRFIESHTREVGPRQSLRLVGRSEMRFSRAKLRRPQYIAV